MTDPVKITLYHANWCGHCVKFLPAWNKIKKTIDAEAGIEHSEYEQEANPDIMKEKGIQGYPTLKMTKKGYDFEYNGPRTEEAIMKALKDPEYLGEMKGGGDKYKAKYLKYKHKYTQLKKELGL